MRHSIQFGVELEFVGQTPSFVGRKLREGGLKVVTHSSNEDFSIDTDSSIGPGVVGMSDEEACVSGLNWGLEFRTPVLDAIPADFKRFKEALDVLTSSCKVGMNRSCGMHVHVSSQTAPYSSYRINGRRFRKLVETNYRHLVWPTRAKWCGSPDDRYSECPAVQLYSCTFNHYEVRIFNGTLNWREISSRVKDVVTWYRESLVKQPSLVKRSIGSKRRAVLV